MSGGGPRRTELSRDEITVIVIAKEPRPGKAKTRLIPALGAEGAARVAEAALADTLAEVAALPDPQRRVLVLDGRPGTWLPEGFEVIPQRDGGLAERLAWAFADAGGPAFLIGMDTPQIGADQIARACGHLAEPDTDAVIGPAEDGGWWGIGLRDPDRRVFADVPMSTSRTGAAQTERLDRLGLRWRPLEPLRDIDTIDDARAVAAEAPGRRFAKALENERPVPGTAEG